MIRVKCFIKNFPVLFKKNLAHFKASPLKTLLSLGCWICFFSLCVSIQLLTMLENLHLVPVFITAIFGLAVFLYCFFYGKFVLNSITFSFVFFLIFGFLSTIFGSKDFHTFFLTQIKLTVLIIMINFCYNFYRPKLFLFLLIFLSFLIALLFIATSFKDIFYLNKVASESRIGNSFFGNVNYLGGALGSGVFFASIYVCQYRKHFVAYSFSCVFFIFLIFRTGSRMPFIISVLSILFTLFYLLWNKHKIILLVILGLMLILFIIVLALPIFSSFSKRFLALFEMLGSGGGEASANQRFSMQLVALQFWPKRLLLGYGSSGFAQISSFGTYSHSTLCEILCDFGLIGFLFFYVPLIFPCFASKKKSLSRTCYLLFATAQLTSMSLFGMLMYEKRFYVYMAIFSTIFLRENESSDFFFLFWRNKKLNFKFTYSFPKTSFLFKWIHMRNACADKRKVNPVAVCLLIVFSFSSIVSSRIVSQFSYSSINETVADAVSEISSVSSSKVCSLSVTSFEDDVNFKTVDKNSVLSRNLTVNKTSVYGYDCRLVYDSAVERKFKFDFDANFNPTALVHTSSGTHKNEKGQNVFNWFEVVTMFEGNVPQDYVGYTSFIEIRESQANQLLDSMGLLHTEENYRSLLNTDFFVYGKSYFDGEEADVKFRINNIILENYGNDQFLYGLYSDYILIYPLNFSSYRGYTMSFDLGSSFPETLDYLNFIEKEFPRNQFVYTLNERPFLNSGGLDASIGRINKWCADGLDSGLSDIISFVLCALVSLFFSCILFLILSKNNLLLSVKNLSSLVLTLFISSYLLCYLLFFFANKLKIFVSAFSVLSTFFSFISLIIFSLFFAVLCCLTNRKFVAKKQSINNNEYTEIDI